MNMAALRASTGLTPAVILMAAPTLEEMIEERDQLLVDSEALINAADEEERDLTEDENTQVNDCLTKVKALNGKISTREAIAAARPPAPTPGTQRRSTPEGARDPNNRVVPASPRDTAKMGFKSLGDFAFTLVAHAKRDEAAVTRMNNVATTFGSEAVGADGGFAVPPEFRAAIWQKVNSQENLLTRCASMPIGGNSITLPKDETTPWQTSGGILAYWEGEGDATTASKPQLKLDTHRLNKLMALVPISEELLSDAPAIEGWLRLKAPAKMVAKINTAIVRGTGVGQPLGILNAESLVSVAKETSQDAASVWFANINKMWARIYAPLRMNAIWLINQDIEPELEAMAFDPEATSKVPVYLPPGGASDTPYARLKGRPVVPVEACSAAGTQGDIILTDLQQYLAITKAGGGVQTDVSMHLYFDQALQAFRFIFRMTGSPMWGSTIARENGSNTLSWAIALDARA